MDLRQLCIINGEMAPWVEAQRELVTIQILRRYAKAPVFPVDCPEVRKIVANPSGRQIVTESQKIYIIRTLWLSGAARAATPSAPVAGELRTFAFYGLA